MTVTLLGHDHRYAVEQMALMLLGDLEKAEGSLTVTAHFPTAATAVYSHGGRRGEGVARTDELGLDAPDTPKGVEQRLVKLATYRAITQATGKTPVWGALSGVRPAKLPTKWLRKGATMGEARALLTDLYCLAPDKADLTLACARESLAVDATLAPNDVSLYIGIPFCPSRCAYCSFISADVKGALALVEPYVAALLEEITWAGDFLRRRGLRLRSVYMGGGTPTTLTASQLDAVLSALDRWLDREPLAEFTVEAGRPDSITAEKLAVLRGHGVERVSVNPQTLSDHVLTAMGRSHTASQFFAAYDLAQEAGFSSINTDLIAGLPQDTTDGFCTTLDGILALAPEEVTIHTLALKHGSTLLADPQAIPGASAVTQMLSYAARQLPHHGYRPYYLYRQKYMTGAMENVGWTKREQGSFYNVVMMEELHSVLALGCGAVTKVIDRATGKVTRHANPKYPKEYLERTRQTIAEREALPW